MNGDESILSFVDLSLIRISSNYFDQALVIIGWNIIPLVKLAGIKFPGYFVRGILAVQGRHYVKPELSEIARVKRT